MARSNLKAVENEMVTGTEDEGSIFEYSIDLADQERPPVLPIGEYEAEVVGFEKKFGKDSGRPYYNVKMHIHPDAQPADFVEALGSQAPITVFYLLMGAEDIPTQRFNMKNFCIALGVPLSARYNPSDFLNKTCKVMISHRKDLSGNDQPNVQKVVKL